MSRAASLFLSHASEDGPAVRELAAQLRSAGLSVWLDLDEMRAGDRWMDRIEAALTEADAFAVYVGRLGLVRWVGDEVRVALDRSVRDRAFRVIPILGPGADPAALPSFLKQHHWLDLRDGVLDPAEVREMVGAILDQPAEAVSLLPPGEPPFVGLQSFEKEQAHLFYGRDREIGELIERLKVAGLLAVVGASGSGKSSLVRAGLVPALHRGRFCDAGGQPQPWRIATLKPGAKPFAKLAQALLGLTSATVTEELVTAFGERLRRGTEGIADYVAAAVPPGERVLIFVDQFEELFTQTADAGERDRFIDALLQASTGAGERPIHAVLTLRADLYSLCFQHPTLPRAISANQYAVPPIDAARLAQVIEKPAAMAGLELEPGLVEDILNDLGGGAGSLPLLEHTLLQLWHRRSGSRLTHASYREIGRVQGALEHHAEEVLNRLAAPDRELAMRLLVKLVKLEPGVEAVRRRLPLEDLAAGREALTARGVLDRLLEARLLTVQAAGSGPKAPAEVELAHEALLRGWDRLQGCLHSDRQFLLWRERALVAAEAWQATGRDAGALLRGAPLLEATRWLHEREPDLGDDLRQLIEASVSRQRRSRRNERLVGLALLALAAATSAGWLAARKATVRAEHDSRAARRALQAVGEMTLVAPGAGMRAEQPEVAELKQALAEKALTIYTEQSGEGQDLRIDQAVAQYRLADLHAVAGQRERAEGEFAAAERTLRALDPRPLRAGRELANTYSWWGTHLGRTDRREEAVAKIDLAIALQTELLCDGGLALAVDLSRSYFNRGLLRTEPAKAMRDYEHARRILEEWRPRAQAAGGKLEEDFLESLARTENGIAVLEKGKARPQQASRSYEAARKAYQLLVDRHPGNREYRLALGAISNNLANLYLCAEDGTGRERAAAMNQSARELLAGLARPGLALLDELGNAHLTQANVLHAAKQPEARDAALERAIDIFCQLVEADPQNEQYGRRLKKALDMQAAVHPAAPEARSPEPRP